MVSGGVGACAVADAEGEDPSLAFAAFEGFGGMRVV